MELQVNAGLIVHMELDGATILLLMYVLKILSNQIVMKMMIVLENASGEELSPHL